MLLPSDVARLVLGYLQEEGLSATSQAFIHESPNLKEYAEHTIGDGTIPACVFSLFGKGLTTILNEYVAVKTKESSHEVPVMMTSLWKKLDFTLNQIKSLQNSPSLAACQRVRSRIGMANMSRQRTLTLIPAGSVVCSSVSETNAIMSPSQSSHGALSHSTPVCYAGPHVRPALPSSPLTTPRDSPVQILVSDHRLNPSGPMSPGRRKWDTPRKRSGAPSGPSGPGRSAASVSGVGAEPQPEEAVDENFPQLVIQNARDKILGDRSLQEKLAENINKILANEPMPQTSKAALNTVEEDQSIDEILGLQEGEIHMSDDAIHDILEQTESDPAFQALFELFDCNRNKFTDGDGDISSSQEESDAAGPSATVRPVQSDDPASLEVEPHASDAASVSQKTKPGQERKNRKTTAPTLIKKVVIGSNGRSSRIENSSARLLVNPAEPRGVSSAAAPSNRTDKASLLSNNAGVTAMDIDEPLNTPPPPFDGMTIEEAVTEESSTRTAAQVKSASSKTCAAISASGETSTSNAGKEPQREQAQGSKEQPAEASSSALNSQPIFLPPADIQLDSTRTQAASLGLSSGPSSRTPEAFSTSSASTGTTVAAMGPSTVTPDSTPALASTSTTVSATSVASTPAPLASTDPSNSSLGNVNKAAADSSNIMSLKIIISDSQEEDCPADAALTQAISSISGDRLPTIYLSSPAKSPAVPPTQKANLDEVALAVSGLQDSEAHASPVSCKAGALVSSPLTGTSHAQPNYFIQLPLDTGTPALQGAAASYFLVTDPPSTDVPTTQMLLPAGVSKGPPLPTNQYGGSTPNHSQGFPAGSALILPSPVKPVVLPVSVMGPNTLAKVQVMSNQLVAIPKPVVVQPPETVMPKLSTVAAKKPAGGGKNLAKKAEQPVAAENAAQQDMGRSPSHRRILCFDPSKRVEPQNVKATTTPTSTPQSLQLPGKNDKQPAPRAKPAILGGNRPKRRVETVRCSADSLGTGGFSKDSNLLQHQQDAVKKNSRKQDHNSLRQESEGANTSSINASEPEQVKRSESEKRSKSVERKNNPDAAKVKDAHGSRSSSSDSTLKSGSKKDKEETCRKEPADTHLKSREGRPEKRPPSQTVPNVTANKENEIKGSVKEPAAASSLASRDFTPSTAAQPISNSQSTTTKALSKTSSLAKQAAEMLQDIQGLKSTSTPTKRPGVAPPELTVPGTGCNQEAPADFPGTPRQKKGKDGEGTPKHLIPPNTPDVPTCSPASEAGSESSINMAAHTLMILSRAAIARTGSPLKNSLRQEGAGGKVPAGSKNSKKRKQTSPTASPPAKKESKPSPSKKKDREKKKLIDCFPHDLDVDKFLSSLHYDE